MAPRTRQVIFSLIPAAITAVLLCLGGWGGYFIATSQFRSQIRASSSNEMLGALLTPVEKAGKSRAYHDCQAAANDMDTFSWVPPNVPTPFVGNAPRPGKSGNATINSAQFRADNEVAVPKPANVYRIFLTGGSTAFGSGAPSQDRTIAGYLAALLNAEFSPRTKLKYEVFTAANPAWASTHERLMIENRLSEMQPDLVLSLSGNNDVHWGRLGRDVLWFRAYADELFFGLLDTAYKVSGYGAIVDPVAPPDASVVPAAVVADRLEKNVRLGWYALSLRKVRYVYCLQPTFSVTSKPLSGRERLLHPPAKDYFASCYGEIDSRLGKLRLRNFHYFNLSDAFDNMKTTDDIFVDAYHFGDRGNEVVARRVVSLLKSIR